MNFPLVPEYQTDLLRLNPDNQVRGEPFALERANYSRILVPRHAPAFSKSVRLYNANHQELTPGTDWRIFKIMSNLTDLTAQSVTCMIEVMNTEVLAGYIDYDIVGEFSLFNDDLMKMIAEMVGQDVNQISWDQIRNKPEWFRPNLHGHSIIRDIMYFKDFVELLDGVLNIAKNQSRTVVEAKISHYFGTFTNYLNAYRTEIMANLNRHKAAYNAHGLNKDQIGLPLVDNFGTVRGQDALAKRSDKHLTPTGLKSIIRTQAVDLDKLLPAIQLPISQFGNSNFIPPNIDGSFEGLGGVSETAGMCVEADGKLVILWNRMDGRVSGLYYSVRDNLGKKEALTTYTGFKYEHPKFVPDAASVDRIAQGSGPEVILVGDSAKDIFYLGLTNGSLDPARHEYTKINLAPILADTFLTPALHKGREIIPMLSVALMGGYVYIVHTSSVGPGAKVEYPNLTLDLRYKYFYRVPAANILISDTVTPVRQNVSYKDADNVQFNNLPYYRWCDKVVDGNGHVTKCFHTFTPIPSSNFTGNYRSAPMVVAQDPKRPTIYAMKFLAAFYASTESANMNDVPEINYDFNPATGVMTRTSVSQQITVNFSQYPSVPDGFKPTVPIYAMVFSYANQGLNVLDNGDTAHSGSSGFAGFPRTAHTARPIGSKTRHSTTQRLWNRGIGFEPITSNVDEQLISPLENAGNQRSVIFTPTGEYFTAAGKKQQLLAETFFRQVSGRFAVRTAIFNKYVPNITSRPLTSNVRKVNVLPGMGGATCVVPTARLSSYGVDVGDGAFCMAAQTKHFNRTLLGSSWTPSAGPDDVLLINAHTHSLKSDGTLDIVPTSETLYPASIVNQLKAQVENVAVMNAARNTLVTICDPTFTQMCTRFGWLPVTVAVQYFPALNGPNQGDHYVTIMTIQPTYNLVGGRQVVTGFSVIDKVHYHNPNFGIRAKTFIWGDNAIVDYYEDNKMPIAATNHGPMRVFYYLDGNKLDVYFHAGALGAAPGDALSIDTKWTYPDRATRRWSGPVQDIRSSGLPSVCMTPDNGITSSFEAAIFTGSAALIQDGPVSKALIASAYPETGWVIYFTNPTKVAFFGKPYELPTGVIDLRDVVTVPSNKTFYIYAVLEDGLPKYTVSLEKQLESPFKLWVAEVVTDATQILTIERFNVFAINGNRVSETKRGGSVPASSGRANSEGQLPWIKDSELIP